MKAVIIYAWTVSAMCMNYDCLCNIYEQRLSLHGLSLDLNLSYTHVVAYM